MGRLFWKFFLVFFLAQGLASLGVGFAVYLHHQRQESLETRIDTGPPAHGLVGAASATLKHGGTEALKGFLKDTDQQDHGPKVLAVDEADHEILGRPLLPETLALARAAYASGRHPDSLTQLAAPDGHRYLIFLPRPHGQAQALRPPQGEFPGILPPDLAPPRGDGPHGPPGKKDWFPTMPLLVGALVSLIFAALLAWYFSKPIRKLRGAFEAAAKGDLALRLGPTMGQHRDELSDLGRDFDRMADRLKTLMDSQRRLLHDVSHELRSPLARMQAAIGLLRQQPERQDEFIKRIERESGRMDKLVSELLTLCRLEVGMAQGPAEKVDLGEILADIIEDARFEAETRHCHIDAPEAASRHIQGHGELLQRAIENVVRNALKYSPDGGLIHIRLEAPAETGPVTLTVSDQGPGVPDAELEAIFKPFHRGPNARTGEGYGLGLAITRSIITAHSGTVRAQNQPQGGLQVSLRLPG